MTLIELTVVLLILIGLAGMLLPYVGSFTQKTHDSTNSSNLASLNDAFNRYVAQLNKIPDNMETLTNSAAAGTGPNCTTTTKDGVFCAMLDPAMFTAGSYTGGTDIIPLTSLTSAGLTSVHENNPAATNKTFGSGVDAPAALMSMTGNSPYDTTVVLPYVKVAALSTTSAAAAGVGTTVAAHLALALGGHENDYNTSCYDYVAMGVGDHNKMIDKTINSAPVHFPENGDLGPVDYYNHYVAILQVDNSNTAPCSSQTEKAKFMGVAMNVPSYPGSHLFGANQSLAYAYQNNSNK